MDHVCLVRSCLELGLMYACNSSTGEKRWMGLRSGLFKTGVGYNVRKYGQLGLHESLSQNCWKSTESTDFTYDGQSIWTIRRT